MLNSWPMSSAMVFSKSTCGSLMNSMRKRIPKQTMKNIPMKEPLYILSSLLT